MLAGAVDCTAASTMLSVRFRLTARQWEALFKDMGLSNSEAERAVRVHDLRGGQGEPDDSEVPGADFSAALWAAMRDAPIIDNSGE